MKKTILLGTLVAILLVGGIALRLKAKKSTAPVVEETVVVTEPTPTASTPVLADGTYTISAENSTANWQGRKPLITDYVDTGTLNIKSGSFTVTGGTLTNGTIVFDMSTIKTLATGKKTGESLMEKHLKSADFFDVEKYPTAQLSMKEAMPGSTPGNYTVKGDLTIKGTTNAVELPVVVSSADKTMTIDSTVTLDRTKWDIRYGSGKFFQNLANNVIDDNFTVVFKMIANMQ